MDASLPVAELERIEAILASYRRHGLDFHALRTRQAGRRAFITLHLLVPAPGPSSAATIGRSESRPICAPHCRACT
jgi:divalent metal cation (Fe/Co/Zn/Cd) transporter